MKLSNRTLSIAALVLLGLSIALHLQSIRRADRFERGQSFLKGLNTDEVSSISLVRGDSTVSLERQGDRFVLAEHDDYRARNDSINRLLRSLLDVTLEKEVGSGPELARRLGLAGDEAGVEPPIEITLGSASGSEPVQILIGKRAEDGGGHYLQRRGDDQAIYLTTAATAVDVSADAYLEKEILNVESSEIATITGADFRFETTEQQLGLTDLPADRSEASLEVNKIKNGLRGLSFDSVLPADHADVAGLRFATALRYELTDGSGYELQTTERGESSYLRVVGFHSVERIAIGVDESEEELSEKAEVLERADEISRFNQFHGSWVYELGSSAADKFSLRKTDLIES